PGDLHGRVVAEAAEDTGLGTAAHAGGAPVCAPVAVESDARGAGRELSTVLEPDAGLPREVASQRTAGVVVAPTDGVVRDRDDLHGLPSRRIDRRIPRRCLAVRGRVASGVRSDPGHVAIAVLPIGGAEEDLGHGHPRRERLALVEVVRSDAIVQVYG